MAPIKKGPCKIFLGHKKWGLFYILAPHTPLATRDGDGLRTVEIGAAQVHALWMPCVALPYALRCLAAPRRAARHRIRCERTLSVGWATCNIRWRRPACEARGGNYTSMLTPSHIWLA